MSEQDEQEKFKAWLEKVCQRQQQLSTSLEQMEIFAREIAEGAINGLWDIYLEFRRTYQKKFDIDTIIHDQNSFESRYFETYLHRRWQKIYPRLELLQIYGYITLNDIGFHINKSAFDLVKKATPTTIFVSYKRSESSALALLVLKSLKAEGLEAFVDLGLEPGENWHAGLKERIEQYDYFILLLGKQTLQSAVVLREIEWAIQAGLRIIPLWHSGFKHVSEEWSNIPDKINLLLATTHAIEVKEESVSGYNTAITELLNLFGITPD